MCHGVMSSLAERGPLFFRAGGDTQQVSISGLWIAFCSLKISLSQTVPWGQGRISPQLHGKTGPSVWLRGKAGELVEARIWTMEPWLSPGHFGHFEAQEHRELFPRGSQAASGYWRLRLVTCLIIFTGPGLLLAAGHPTVQPAEPDWVTRAAVGAGPTRASLGSQLKSCGLSMLQSTLPSSPLRGLQVLSRNT